jgi:hypothetical protein
MSKKKSKQKLGPIHKGLYAWNAIHAGSFLLYVEALKDCYSFLFLPGPSEYYLTVEDFEKSLSNRTLEFVEALPDEIFKESVELSLSRPLKQQKMLM